jgi:rhodanese-related sulfurtransferase
MASHAAARRAVKAGYKNVRVMADGIVGWKEAGQKTAGAPVD